MKFALHENRVGQSPIPVEEIHLALLQALPDGLCFLDLQSAIRFWNQAAEEITGFSTAEALCARQASDIFFISGMDGQPMALAGDAAADAGQVAVFLRHKDGHAIPVALRRLTVQNQEQAGIGTLWSFVSHEVAPVEVPATQPVWLSGQPEQSPVGWLEEQGRLAGILLIRIDGFADLEHRFGPEASEKFSALVERTTSNCLRGEEGCRSLSGGVVLAAAHATGSHLVDLARRIRSLVESARIQWWGEAIHVTVSIGCKPLGAQDTRSDAIRQAEEAAAQAQAQGGNRVIVAEG